MNRNTLIGIGVAVVLLGIFVWWMVGKNAQNDGAETSQRGVEGAPLDITLDVYGLWLTALKATNTDPIALNLHNEMAISNELSAELATLEGKDRMEMLGRFFCQQEIPRGLRALPAYETEVGAQVLVRASNSDLYGQAVVTLVSQDSRWTITDISCDSGESAPEGEFTFDREGFLLKDSVPPPLNPENWYLVFEENGANGHTAPLILNVADGCGSDGAALACNPDELYEAAHVRVQGNMTEAGVEVQSVRFVE